MKFSISTTASDYIKQKGGEIIIFKGSRSLGGCTGASIPTPMMKVGHPNRPLENYQLLKETGVTIYLANELLNYQGTAKIDLDKILFWKSLSFDYLKE
ncbi:CC/Se motif family (seleno)protein [Anaerosolibacter sp.]|uniref:CC/Se motif family (seleno)protein n=1 Tax=Anaerosolibacter sp. TaxID=1872527 RepID=UPI0039EF7FDF